MSQAPLPLDFYRRPTDAVARDLLGCWLIHESPQGLRGGVIVETESYADSCDPASHAYRKETARNRAMFGPVGRAYVYFIYGNHYCFNVVAHPDERAGAVLVRALEPRLGLDLMRASRGRGEAALCNGPGKLCQALAIGAEHYGLSLHEGPLRILAGEAVAAQTSTRIGIRVGREHLWRFFVPGNSHVSKGRPA